ncbi:MAG: hypothetical protein ACJ790_06015 [Myxococcaceae bacterium]
MASRWDHLLETKPIPLLEHLKDEVAKLLAKELANWPPPMEELDPAFLQKNAQLFEPGAQRPKDLVYVEAFRLTRWEMERNVDAVDDYMRNSRFVERGLEPTDKSALLVLSRWLTEQMLALSESTNGRTKRKDLIEILDRLERRLNLKILLA